jgi:hypothetical protein
VLSAVIRSEGEKPAAETGFGRLARESRRSNPMKKYLIRKSFIFLINSV